MFRATDVGKIDYASLEPIDFEGLEIRDYTSALDGSSSLAEITVPPWAIHRRSWSKRSDKYYYVIHGELEFTLGDEALHLHAGDCCIVRQGTRFSYRNASEREALLLLVHTPSFDLAQEMFEEP